MIRELRIAVCRECNYKCFFCHSEGLDRNGAERYATVAEMTKLIADSVACGLNDVTFTGGEPLIRKRDLQKVIAEVGTLPNPPNVTIVTNGELLDREFIDAVSIYPGALKFNISVHALKRRMLQRIVQIDRDPTDRVVTNIRMALDAGIKVKINALLLKGVNSSLRFMWHHMVFFRKLGVSGIKFLEMIVTEQNFNEYRYYFSDEAIRRNLVRLGCFEMPSPPQSRSRRFQCRDWTDFTIEVTRCCCRLGCRRCAELNDHRQWDSELNLHPCFLNSSCMIAWSKTPDLKAVYAESANRKREISETYGTDSPLLVPIEHFGETYEDVYFITPMRERVCRDALRNSGLVPLKRREFVCFYYRPVNVLERADFNRFTRVKKMGYDVSTPNKMEIIDTFEHGEMRGELYVQVKTFASPRPIEVPGYTKSAAHAFMQTHGEEIWFKHRFNVTDFGAASGENMLSIDFSTTPANIKVAAGAVRKDEIAHALKVLGARQLNEPFQKWISRLKNGGNRGKRSSQH